MRLRDLEATFLKIESPTSYRRTGDQRGDADGVHFLCPLCFQRNGGPAGTHAVKVWFEHVGQDVFPTGGRWTAIGTSLDDLTTKPSIQIVGGCNWHGYITNGDAA